MYCGCEQPQARTISVLVVYFASEKRNICSTEIRL